VSLRHRIARSASALNGVLTQEQFHDWFDRRRALHEQRVRRIPFRELRGWGLHPDTGNLVHDSGRFFAIEGLHVRSSFGPVREWSQPIINQPEIGILGIATREIDGVLHFLMQAKAEPGNVNGLQLAPTMQATRSNYSRVHGGQRVPFLDEFLDCDPRRVVVDVLQSEQGAWFYHKRNRNVVIELDSDVDAGEDFCWLTLGQLNRLLLVDNLVNMDARTVLSCLPAWYRNSTSSASGEFGWAIGASSDRSVGSLHPTPEVLSWITRMHTEHELVTGRVPLRGIDRWRHTEDAISHELGVFFSVIAVDVEAGRREVTRWTQPLLEPHGEGLVGLVVKRFDGVVHALVNAQVEPGHLDVVELAPTVQCTPENYAHLPPGSAPPYLDVVLAARPEQIRVDVELSEEGGRFRHATSRYVIVEVDEDFVDQAPPQFHWLTLSQLTGLVRHSHYVNVQARTLIALLRALL
jgi:oxidase EvaA